MLAFREEEDARLIAITAQNRLQQVSGHLAGSGSKIAPTEGDRSSGRAKLLQKNPDDVRLLNLLSSNHS